MSSGAGSAATGAAAGAVRSRVSLEQLELLLSFMEEHREFAAGKQSVYSRFSSSKLWRLLAERLNAAAQDSGGARKSPDKWCRYWADIKYKARKKSAAGGALGELSHAEERLRGLLGAEAGGGGGGVEWEEGERERKPLEEEEEEGGSSEELLCEAAMRAALAAEKQAEAVAQGVELLRELVSLVRACTATPHHEMPIHHRL